MMKIERGTALQVRESSTRGWVIGPFASGLGNANGFEVKLWQYDDEIDYAPKPFPDIEFIVVYGGILKIVLQKGHEKEVIVLHGKNHEWVLLESGLTRQVIPLQVPVFGVTVRGWPNEL